MIKCLFSSSSHVSSFLLLPPVVWLNLLPSFQFFYFLSSLIGYPINAFSGIQPQTKKWFSGDDRKLNSDSSSSFLSFLNVSLSFYGLSPVVFQQRIFNFDTLLLFRAEVRDALKATGPEVKGQGSPWMWGCSLFRSSRWRSLRWGRSVPPMGRKRRWTQVRGWSQWGVTCTRPGTLRSKVDHVLFIRDDLVYTVMIDVATLHADFLEEEVEFNWEEYMEETGAAVVPHTAFRHVSAHFDFHR